MGLPCGLPHVSRQPGLLRLPLMGRNALFFARLVPPRLRAPTRSVGLLVWPRLAQPRVAVKACRRSVRGRLKVLL
jgi:hypothetical protein